MKKIISKTAVFFTCVCSSALTTLAVNTAAPTNEVNNQANNPNNSTSGSKYGVVDMQRVILGVEEGKQARLKLEQEIKGKEDDLRKKKEELDKLNEQWKKEASLLSEDAKMRKQQDFQQKFLDLRNDEMNFKQEIQRKEGEATQKIAMQVAQIVNNMAQDMKFEIVFEANSAGVLYAKDPTDLTSKVIEVYEGNAKQTKISKK